ncbi:MAG: YraN family protein [Proteobacteria bacterium]|nr:YraN family protein [Pseudomonadota bacterium]
MPSKDQLFGKEGETLAALHLKKQGYKIIEQNYRTKLGEIDIIAKDNNTLVFVEVKSRKTGDFGSPKYAVTPKKMKKISMVALYFLKETKQSGVKARFDVVSISPGEREPEIEIIKNAFDLAYG